jgi:hypothetical protein
LITPSVPVGCGKIVGARRGAADKGSSQRSGSLNGLPGADGPAKRKMPGNSRFSHYFLSG